jgi:hypothetical protein
MGLDLQGSQPLLLAMSLIEKSLRWIAVELVPLLQCLNWLAIPCMCGILNLRFMQ